MFILTFSCIRSINKGKSKRAAMERELKNELELNEEEDDEIRVSPKRDFTK